jgi:gamma-glutamyltranspeptidase/glutathione hydrolase
MNILDRIQARSIVICKEGLVTSESPLASQAGVSILNKGGSAVDAAIAANAVMGVVAPMSCGIGGDLFAIIFDANTNKLIGLNASGNSSKYISDKILKEMGYKSMPSTGATTVTVPGTVNGWQKLLEKFGVLKFSEVLKPAIYYAENGFPITEQVASLWHEARNIFKNNYELSKIFLIENTIPKTGIIFKNQELANAYRLIAELGYKAYYDGPIGEKIIKTIKSHNGFLNFDDLGEYESKWVELIKTNYRGWDIFEMPPNTQGIAALLMLNIMENFSFEELGHNSAESLHIMIEAKKLAYADLMKYVGDPDFNKIPTHKLLSKEYAKDRAKLIDPNKSINCFNPGIIKNLAGDTVYLCSVDKKGNMVSLIQSNFVSSTFGSGIVVEDYGFVLHNRGAIFNLIKDHPNCLKPKKRPLHTIIPAFMTKNNLKLAFGIMGGFNQAQAHAQFVANIVDFKFNIQYSLEAPRFTKHTFEGNDVMLEERIDKFTIEKLTNKGHIIEVRGGYSQEMGGGQAIMRDYNSLVNFGASDPRKDGIAIPETI